MAVKKSRQRSSADCQPFPLTDAAFAPLMDALNLSALHKMAVAVSGGPDSLALAYLLARWAAGQQQRPELHVLCVDHGLRAEAAQEALQVQAIAQSWPGVKAEILRWGHEAVVTRIQEQARAARYQLLAGYCRAQGIAHLFLAHHQDDQAETILFRLAKGSGLDGLCGMRAVQNYDEALTLLRPLLSVPKTVLADTCRAAGLDYSEDPSNESRDFARVRLRQARAVLEGEGLTSSRLSTLGERLQRAQQALDSISENSYNDMLLKNDTDRIVLNFKQMQAQPEEVALRCLMKAIKTLSGDSGYGPRLERIEDVLEDLLHSENFRKRTLGGLIFAVEEHDGEACLMLCSEKSELPPRSKG